MDELKDMLREVMTAQALHAQQLGHVVEHLSKLNGRIGKAEDQVRTLELNNAEGRGRQILAQVFWGLLGGFIIAVGSRVVVR